MDTIRKEIFLSKLNFIQTDTVTLTIIDASNFIFCQRLMFGKSCKCHCILKYIYNWVIEI